MERSLNSGPCATDPVALGENRYSRSTWQPPAHSGRAERVQRTAYRAPAPRESAAMSGALRVVPLVAAVGLAVFLLVAVGNAVQAVAGALGGASADVQTVQLSSATPADLAATGGAVKAESTPRDAWRAGEMPFLYQIDEAYASAPYAGANVGESGCGPTSLAMVYVALTGKTDLDPATMAAFSENNGYVEEGLTSWLLMSDGAAQLGLASHEVSASASQLTAELQAGRPVICSVGPGDFTEKGHFIVLAGMADDGRLVVHDPNSPDNSARTWDVQRVLDQCRNLWAFELA